MEPLINFRRISTGVQWTFFVLCVVEFQAMSGVTSAAPEEDLSTVVVLFSNGHQLHRAVKTIQGLRYEGDWQGDIVYMHPISGDFDDAYYRRQLECYNVTIRAIAKVEFQAKQNKYYTAKRVDPERDAWVYFMKFHVFDAYFAVWDRVFYVDSGVAVQKPIQHILDLNVSGRLTAFSDTWPDYTWRLHGQFYPKEYPREYESMQRQNYNLEIDYFMSTVMYFDTRAVLPHPVPLRENTVSLLYSLARQFPHCNGDQAIMALVFCAMKPVWMPLPIRTDATLLYDYLARSGPAEDYVMLKMNNQQVPPERLCTTAN